MRGPESSGDPLAVGIGIGPFRSILPHCGRASVWLGSLCMALIAFAMHFESFRGADASWLLDAVDRLGLVKTPEATAIMGLRAPRLFSFTDETALLVVLSLGTCLATAAVLSARWAERRGEDNLLLSAGFICGIGGLFLAHPVLGASAIAIGTAVAFGLRHAHRREFLRGPCALRTTHAKPGTPCA